MANDLTDRAKLFVKAFVGEAKFNATKAAKIAGYAHPHSVGASLKKKYSQAIEEAMFQGEPSKIVSSNEALQLLAEIARDPSHRDRLRAIELVLKCHGLLSDKLNLNIRREDLTQQLVEIAQNLLPSTTDNTVITN